MGIILISFPIILYLYLFFIYYKKTIEVYDTSFIEKESFIKKNLRLLIKNMDIISRDYKDYQEIEKEYTNLFNVEVGMLSNKVNDILKLKSLKFKIFSFIFIFLFLPLLILSEERINKRFVDYLIKKQNVIYENKKKGIVVNQFFELFYLNKEKKVHRNNKEAFFNLFKMEKKFYNNGNLLEKKEFKKVVLKDKINNF
tara:strand:+ start:194 stop:787 length:594 start_codon:yes stop_codon:yes gene_type:complete